MKLTKYCKVVLVSNIKGGIAKTTTALNITSILTLLGLKVLVIDTDPQANCSDTARVTDTPNSIFTLTKYGIDPFQCIYPSEFGFDVIPGDKRFKEAIPYLMEDNTTFKQLFEPLKEHYDFIIVDSLPTENKVVMNNLFFADYIIAPVKPSRYSVEGFTNLLGDIHEANLDGATVELLGILMVMYKRRTSNDVYIEKAREDFKNIVFDTYINDVASVENCEALQMPLVFYDKKDKATKQYISLTFEMLDRMGYETDELEKRLNRIMKKRGVIIG